MIKFKSYMEYLRDCSENAKKPVKYNAYKKTLYKQMNRETKQKVLDMILKSMKFGEISKKLGITLDEVCSVFEANLNKFCLTELNKEAI